MLTAASREVPQPTAAHTDIYDSRNSCRHKDLRMTILTPASGDLSVHVVRLVGAPAVECDLAGAFYLFEVDCDMR